MTLNRVRACELRCGPNMRISYLAGFTSPALDCSSNRARKPPIRYSAASQIPVPFTTTHISVRRASVRRVTRRTRHDATACRLAGGRRPEYARGAAQARRSDDRRRAPLIGLGSAVIAGSRVWWPNCRALQVPSRQTNGRARRRRGRFAESVPPRPTDAAITTTSRALTLSSAKRRETYSVKLRSPLRETPRPLTSIPGPPHRQANDPWHFSVS
jgi:hypothetical protein